MTWKVRAGTLWAHVSPPHPSASWEQGRLRDDVASRERHPTHVRERDGCLMQYHLHHTLATQPGLVPGVAPTGARARATCLTIEIHGDSVFSITHLLGAVNLA